MEWIAQLSLENWIAAAGVAAAATGTVYAIRLSRDIATRNCDQQYFIEYGRRYQELISQAPHNIRDPNFELASCPNCERILQLAHAYLDMCFEQWYLHQRRLISFKLWSFWKSAMKAGLSRPAFRQAWIIIRRDKRCDENFLRFVERFSSSNGRARAVRRMIELLRKFLHGK